MFRRTAAWLLVALAASLLAAGTVLAAAAKTEKGDLTDDDVVKAINKAKQLLMGQQKGDGTWPEQRYHAATADYGHSEMALFTLTYISQDPEIGQDIKLDALTKGLDALMTRALDYTYAISLRTMAYAYLQKRVSSPKKELVRKALQVDALWLVQAQGSHGGWDYKTLNASDGRYDLSNTQMAILALREAALAGVEIPDFVWKRSQSLYFKLQKDDGAWNYGEHNKDLGQNTPGYGSMTAAGLASIFICMDNLDLASGCPCRAGASNRTRGDFERRIDSALSWLEKNFKPAGNPKAPRGNESWHKYYWLYSVERVGIAAGYKYFGNHNWYREGAESLVKAQQPNGSWGDLPDTCFATLFLFKGRAAVLYNKLEFKGEWNSHRRDIANLTNYIIKEKEQLFNWEIVTLRAPVRELHEAPILFITPESVPEFSDGDKKKLREFTDTGGTILIEASCGSPAVRKWAQEFLREVWPEWPLKPLGPDHGSFLDPNPLKQRPEILGVDDGIRTLVFYSMDDIGCPWQTKAVTGRDYLFKWGINLFTYATDHSPLRAKLATAGSGKRDRYTSSVRAGDKGSLRIARLKYEGNWTAGRHYKPFEELAQVASKRANLSLKVEDGGVDPAQLGDQEIVYLVGSGPVTLTEPQRQGLKQYLAKGGFVWAEAAGGTIAFDQAFRKLAQEMGWQLTLLPQNHPALTGKFAKAVGYSLLPIPLPGVQFSRALRTMRLGPRACAELIGVYEGKKLVGVYSPFDVMFSLTDYSAYGCRGYQTPDARAVAINTLLLATDRPPSE